MRRRSRESSAAASFLDRDDIAEGGERGVATGNPCLDLSGRLVAGTLPKFPLIGPRSFSHQTLVDRRYGIIRRSYCQSMAAQAMRLSLTR